MAYLNPDQVYYLALEAIPKVIEKYPVSNRLEFAKVLTGQAFQESCLDKKRPYACFDTEAKPYANKQRTKVKSTAFGLTQVLEGTQRAIERLMGWPQRPLDDRSNPVYALALAAAYMGYFYNGGAKTPRGDWHAALVSYHDGHYSKGGAGQTYAKLIKKHVGLFDLDNWGVRVDTDPAVRQSLIDIGANITQGGARWLEHLNRAEFR